MIYIYSTSIALLLTVMLVFYLKKNGYFVLNKAVGVPINEERLEIPSNESNDINSTESEIGPNDTDSDYEKNGNVRNIASFYGRNSSMIFTFVFFLLAIALNYLMYTYTVIMPEDAQPFLFVKMAITNGIVACAALTDYKRHIIPNALILFGLMARFIIYLLEYIIDNEHFMITLKNDALGFIIGFVMLFIIAVVSRGGIGFGDVKLFGVIGLMSGSAGVFTTIFLSLAINSIVAIGLMAAKRKTIKSTLPMAPFIYIGYFLVCALGLF